MASWYYYIAISTLLHVEIQYALVEADNDESLPPSHSLADSHASDNNQSAHAGESGKNERKTKPGVAQPQSSAKCSGKQRVRQGDHGGLEDRHKGEESANVSRHDRGYHS